MLLWVMMVLHMHVCVCDGVTHACVCLRWCYTRMCVYVCVCRQMLTYGRRIPLPELDYRIQVKSRLVNLLCHHAHITCVTSISVRACTCSGCVCIFYMHVQDIVLEGSIFHCGMISPPSPPFPSLSSLPLPSPPFPSLPLPSPPSPPFPSLSSLPCNLCSSFPSKWMLKL